MCWSKSDGPLPLPGSQSCLGSIIFSKAHDLSIKQDKISFPNLREFVGKQLKCVMKRKTGKLKSPAMETVYKATEMKRVS